MMMEMSRVAAQNKLGCTAAIISPKEAGGRREWLLDYIQHEVLCSGPACRQRKKRWL
jgi:hypothetical protein